MACAMSLALVWGRPRVVADGFHGFVGLVWTGSRGPGHRSPTDSGRVDRFSWASTSSGTTQVWVNRGRVGAM